MFCTPDSTKDYFQKSLTTLYKPSSATIGFLSNRSQGFSNLRTHHTYEKFPRLITAKPSEHIPPRNSNKFHRVERQSGASVLWEGPRGSSSGGGELQRGPRCRIWGFRSGSPVSFCYMYAEDGGISDRDAGFIPFLGYHHVLMIFIAIAIILLCKSAKSQAFNLIAIAKTLSSSAFSWLLIIITCHSQYIPNLSLLQILPSNIWPGASRPGSDFCNSEYRGTGANGSPSGLFRHLHKLRQRLVPVQ